MVGAGAHDVEPGGVVDTLFAAEYFERNEPLVVIHGQYAVEFSVAAVREESVCAVRSVCRYAFETGTLYSRCYYLLLFASEQAAVSGMGIEAEHGYARRSYREVAYERTVHHAYLFENVFRSDPCGDLDQRFVYRNQTYLQYVAHHEH